ncbi:hypothetical protein MPSEU_000112700 [Mayamaea pseudoterrestris]|nr:hypothetical protein MPSEU_000112700 [Mayamaea pseudoterrestris]
MSDDPYNNRPGTRHGTSKKRRASSSKYHHGGVAAAMGGTLFDLGDPSKTGRPRSPDVFHVGSDDDDEPLTAAAQSKLQRKRPAVNNGNRKDVFAAANGRKRNKRGFMGPLDVARSNQGEKQVLKQIPKMKEGVKKVGALNMMKIPRKQMPINSCDPSMNDSPSSDVSNHNHNRTVNQQQQRQQPIKAPAKQEVVDLMDDNSSTESEVGEKRRPSPPAKQSKKAAASDTSTSRYSLHVSTSSSSSNEDSESAPSDAALCNSNRTSASDVSSRVGPDGKLAKASASDASRNDGSDEKLTKGRRLRKYGESSSSSKRLKGRKKTSASLIGGHTVTIKELATTPKPIDDTTSALLDDIFHGQDDSYESDDTIPLPINGGQLTRKMESAKANDKKVYDVPDDDDGDEGRDDASGRKLAKAVAQSETEVYCASSSSSNEKSLATRSKEKMTDLYNVASSAVSAVASTFSLTKHNNERQNSAEAKKPLRKAGNKQKGSAIVVGASIQNRDSEEPTKSRAYCSKGFKEPHSLDQRGADRERMGTWFQNTPSTNYSTNYESGTRRSSRLLASQTTALDDDKITNYDDSNNAAVYEKQNRLQRFLPSRIAIGKKVSKGKCFLQLSRDSIAIKCCIPKGRVTRCNPDADKDLVEAAHTIQIGDIEMMKLFTPDDNDFPNNDREGDLKPFFALQATKNSKNQLIQYSNVYQPDKANEEYRYIVIEFDTQASFDEVIAHLTGMDRWAKYTQEECRIDTRQEAAHFTASLAAQSAAITKRNLVERTTGKDAYPFLAGKDTILVYPFDGDVLQIEKAAADLTVFGGPDYAVLNDQTNHVVTGPDASMAALETADETKVAKKISSGTVTLLAEDFLLLEPGEWLNDNVIDFVLRWISRNNDGKDSHFFSTHFYTKLADHGVDAVASWTSRKNRELNIFEKKMIFIPINKALHWSLCVIVNPGRIKDFIDLQEAGATLSEESSDLPCILFFDSLKSHNKNLVQRNIHKWLNREWERLKGDRSGPFHEKSMRLFMPEVPRQDNFCDCGVFVCRYAYALYQLSKGTSFKVRDGHEGNQQFYKTITNAKEFKFDMEEIQLLRKQLMSLIERLHYLHQTYLTTKALREAAEEAKDDEKKESNTSFPAASGAESRSEMLPDLQSNPIEHVALPVDEHTLSNPVIPKLSLVEVKPDPGTEMMCKHSPLTQNINGACGQLEDETLLARSAGDDSMMDVDEKSELPDRSLVVEPDQQMLDDNADGSDMDVDDFSSNSSMSDKDDENRIIATTNTCRCYNSAAL